MTCTHIPGQCIVHGCRSPYKNCSLYASLILEAFFTERCESPVPEVTVLRNLHKELLHKVHHFIQVPKFAAFNNGCPVGHQVQDRFKLY
jgi:hypothetical protein